MEKPFLLGPLAPRIAKKRTGVQAQGVADIIKTEGVGELGEDQAHDMTPRCESAGFFCDAGVAGQLRDQVCGNQIAELAQEGETAARWFADRLFFSSPTLWPGSSPQANSFFTSPNHQS